MKMAIYVDENLCKSCGLCVAACPKGVLAISDKVNKRGYNYVQPVHPDSCIQCSLCEHICPDFAICVHRSDEK